MQLIWDNWVKSLCISNKSSHNIRMNYMFFFLLSNIHKLVHTRDMVCKFFIHFFIVFIK